MGIAFLTAPKRPAYTNLMDGYNYRGLLAVHVIPLVILYLVAMFLVHRIARCLLAIPLASFVGDLTKDEELKRAVRKRFTKSSFIYGRKGVPEAMRRVRLLSTPNTDGTYWMMTMDSKFTVLTFQKYRTGEIDEPNDPDLPSVKYLPGTNPWVDLK